MYPEFDEDAVLVSVSIFYGLHVVCSLHFIPSLQSAFCTDRKTVQPSCIERDTCQNSIFKFFVAVVGMWDVHVLYVVFVEKLK